MSSIGSVLLVIVMVFLSVIPPVLFAGHDQKTSAGVLPHFLPF